MFTQIFRVLKSFFWDENYFSQKLRAAIGFLGMLVIAGVITVPEISPDTPWGAYVTKFIGAALAACAWWVRAGDKTTPGAAALEHAPQQAMEAGLVAFGVPAPVAIEAAAESETKDPPPIRRIRL